MMEFHENPSPIRGKNVEFSYPEEMVLENIFLPLGLAPRGRYHVVLFSRETSDYSKLYINKSNSIHHTSGCIQYFLYGSEGGVVGSVFELRYKKAKLDHHFLCLSDSDEDTPYSSPLDKDNGGVIVFCDEQNSVVVIPSSPNVSEFMVVD